MTIGQKIHSLRKLSGLSQENLAEKLNVSRQTVSKWERDECQPELEKAIAIARLFDITTDELLIGEKEPRLSPGFNELVQKNERAAKKKTAVKIFLCSLGLLLTSFVLTPVMQLMDKSTKGMWYTHGSDYLREAPLSIFLWVSIIGMLTGVIMLFAQFEKNSDKEE